MIAALQLLVVVQSHRTAGVFLQTVSLPDGTEIDVTVGLGGSAIGAFLTTLLVGAVLVALVPGYTERMMDTVRGDVGCSAVYGFLALVSIVLLTILLVVSIVGIFVVIPLLILAYVIWAVGAAIAFLAIGDRLVDHSDGWLKPLVVGASINGSLTLTGIGCLLSFCIGAAGFGAFLCDRLD